MANKGPSMDLSSFQDIMTCILGILILIILLTGIDASQIVVLVATPRQASTSDDRRPVLFECRNNQIFAIDRMAVEKACEERAAKIYADVNGNETEFLKSATAAFVTVNGYRVDFGLSMTGTYLLYPIESTKGFEFKNFKEEQISSWFANELAKYDPERDFVCLFVRPNSFDAFQRARAVAWLKGFSIACELLQPKEPVKLGVGGSRVLAQ